MSQLDRSFALEDLNEVTEAYDIEAFIFMESGCMPRLHLKELRWAQQQADTDRRIRAIIPWAPVEHKTLLEASIKAMASDPRVKGVRRILQGESDTAFCLRADFMRGIALLQDNGLHFELTLNPAQLAAAAELADRFPCMDFILDHIGNPDIRSRRIDAWASDLLALAKHPNVVCKISSLPVNAGTDWDSDMLMPYFDITVDAFGPDRVLFASDWPNLLRASSYRDWMEMLDQATESWSVLERSLFFRENARRVYRIGRS